MRQYENEVQKVKHEVLEMIARYAFNGNLIEHISLIPEAVNPGPEGRFRCCIYHERAITAERIQMTLGGNGHPEEIVEVLGSACDHCLVERFVVTETCRGCLAHRCVSVCPVEAIAMRDGKAYIDPKKCIECGKCHQVCPYSAIADVRRPCVRGCKSKAIHVDENKKAVIDYDLCIDCGACVYNCPFGAIQDKSEILPVIDAILEGKSVYAMLAPAFATQFQHVDLEQVITGIKAVGFRDVIEVALGADLVIKHEAEEVVSAIKNSEKITTSCCPSFVNYIEKKYPELKKYISKTISPMVATSKIIKEIDPEGITVFIGPCIAKKQEKNRSGEVDFVLTFEELSAIIDAKNIVLEEQIPSPLNNASQYGRAFAASEGVSNAVAYYTKTYLDQTINAQVCDGIEACDKALRLLKVGRLEADLIEGMSCQGGCIKGPVTMHHGPLDRKALQKYSQQAHENDLKNSNDMFKIEMETN